MIPNKETFMRCLSDIPNHTLDLFMRSIFTNKVQKITAILSATDTEINTGLSKLGSELRIKRGE